MEAYCTCSVDRYLRPLSHDQLKQLQNNPQSATGMETSAAQCMTEMMRPPAAGNETAGNEAAPAAPGAPGAPGAPAAEDGEAAEANETSGQ